uniref:Methyltransferase domain-containing protein n=1 Tax=Timspurckia oligopyrenoides TaxID=708627 RepID=A0A7S0ZGU2_9RHOD|mmetsp:Transcript_4711/g.8219  ORF Transcript_4711/g.8219 Transcript_4711/m.8219 type:complete len:369 (+) Transcript_4711:380-1486(+)
MDMQKAGAIKGLLMGYSTAHLVTSNLAIGMHFNLFSILEAGSTDGLTVEELASRAQIKNVRVLKEWALCLVANGFLECKESSDGERYVISPEAALFFRMDGNPFSGFWPFLNSLRILPQLQPVLVEKYATGTGFQWGDLPEPVHDGVTDFFAPVYEHLLPSWMKLHPDTHRKLQTGGKLLDIGCGAGKSTCVLAREYPEATFVGVDYHKGSIVKASERADHDGRKNAVFKVADSGSASWHGTGEADVVSFFDCFHDMENPGGAAKQAYAALKDDGVVILIEPLSSDEEGVSGKCSLPTTGLFSGASSHICTLNALGADGTGAGLGACCPTSKHRELFKEAGFKSLDVLSMDGPFAPTANGFRFMLATK